MRKIIDQSMFWEVKKYKKFRFMINKSNKLIVFGLYPDRVLFCGTDMLSMAVQPDVLDFIEKFSKKHSDYNFIAEGDRLNNPSFFNKVKKFLNLEIIRLFANQEMLKERRIKRGSKQTDAFIKRVSTKLSNIEKKFDVKRYNNFTEKDQEKIIVYVNKKVWKNK